MKKISAYVLISFLLLLITPQLYALDEPSDDSNNVKTISEYYTTPSPD